MKFLMRSVRLLGLGTDCVRPVACGHAGAMRLDALADALHDGGDAPTILCLQAGDLNTGAYDPFEPACALAHASGAWVHVDGAFGLWAAASDRFRHLLRGAAAADSWATDGHKWLNLPYDSGFVFVADPEAHRAAFAQATSYAVLVDDTRRQMNWNPEWSRRGRAFAAYAAIRALGAIRHRRDDRTKLRSRDAIGRRVGGNARRRGSGPPDRQSGTGAVPGR